MNARPEILAPAGTALAMRAAVENGADAIYFGLERHNARERAENFTLAALPEIVAGLHERGVLAYVTFNTLIYQSELEDAARMLAGIAAAGADAIIVQDLGAMKLAREICPQLPLHASTQATVTDAPSAELTRSLGARRAILARELSVAEIATIARATSIELEVFVHGALCVSYSGQCFTSASWGGRSANRGECAQACRLPYDLVVDGQKRDLDDVRYLLSPHDLMGVDAIAGLIAAGVVSFKIEGRLKSPEYVAATTAIYRTAVDRALSKMTPAVTKEERHVLQQVYSRGVSAGFLAGTDHQAILEGVHPSHRGIKIGAVRGRDIGANSLTVDLENELRRGDGLLVAGGDPESGGQGGRAAAICIEGDVVESAPAGKRVQVVFDHRSLMVASAPLRATLWRNRDPALDESLRATFAGEQALRRAPITMTVSGRAGAALVIDARDADGHPTTCTSTSALTAAHGRALDREILFEKLGRLGGSPFELAALECRIAGDCHLPVSELNAMRRQIVADLIQLRRRPPTRLIATSQSLGAAERDSVTISASTATPAAAALIALCRNDQHLAGAIDAGAREVALDYMELVGLGRAVQTARAHGLTVGIAPTRIQKPDEDKILQACVALAPDWILVRNLGALEVLSQRAPDQRPRLIGDFSLNAANSLAANLLLARGLETIVPSYDLSMKELDALLDRVDPARIEIVVHQHLPMFHTEYCAYARLLSKGTSFRDCGRPCEEHRVSLADPKGVQHPVLVDVSCRNTVFSARANSVADEIPRFLARGIRRFRVEMLEESREAASTLIAGYLSVLAGSARGDALRKSTGAAHRLGVLTVE